MHCNLFFSSAKTLNICTVTGNRLGVEIERKIEHGFCPQRAYIKVLEVDKKK